MTRFRLVMAQTVHKRLLHLPPQFTRKVKAALQALAGNPYQAKELKDDLVGLRSFRVAHSRLILLIKGTTVEIVAFGPRKDIYQRAVLELNETLKSPE